LTAQLKEDRIVVHADVFETDRLVISQPDDDGYRFVRECLADAELTKFVPGAPFGKEILDIALNWMKNHWREHGFGQYVATEKASGKKIAMINIRWEETVPPNRELDLGFIVIKAFQKRGVAAEASKVLLDFGFNELGASSIVAKTKLTNPGSVRVLEKLGFKSVGQVVLDNSVIGKQTYDKFELMKPKGLNSIFHSRSSI
jgi:RimJ/RimL family protein N-acetyltransferase